MKKIIILLIPLLFVLGSCEDVFEREPLDKISESEVWQQEPLMRAYISDMYARFPWQGYQQTDRYTEFGTQKWGNSTNITTGTVSRTSEAFGFWNYSLIRDMNIFIEKVKDSPISETAKRQMEGEVRAMRAVVYFEKQRRYGGVPLVDISIDPFSEIDEKYTKRSTEEEIADFVDSELSTAIGLLEVSHAYKSRFNRWNTLAYKARASLWAASIAKYGTVQLNGVVGIPSGRANEFFRKAADAADEIIKSERYALYNKISNRTENYYRLFFDGDNPEAIFERTYDGVNIGHTFTQDNIIARYSAGQGAVHNPTVEFLQFYENVDGSTDQLELGPDHLYVDGPDLISNKDPRLRATVFMHGEPFRDDIINSYDGLDPSPEPDPNTIIAGWTLYHEGVVSVGTDGNRREDHNKTNSGLNLRKYVRDYGPVLESAVDDVNYIVIRLAEMYLIVAEAEFELGNLNPAVGALNATRERAGISLVDEGSITLETVRRERSVELAYEDFRYWDIRRWRTAMDIMNRDEPIMGLHAILHYETGLYYFLPYNCENFTRIFRSEHYYNPITNARRENNPDLIENPGY